VADVAAVASCEHAYALVRAHGEAGFVHGDGLIYAGSMTMLDSARGLRPAPHHQSGAWLASAW
jgi:hypothetical protein